MRAEISSINAIRGVATPILNKYGVVRSALFGSVVRGESSEASDIDFLVEFPPESTLLDLVGLEQELEEAFGRDVDVITFRSLHPLLKEYVLREAVVL